MTASRPRISLVLAGLALAAGVTGCGGSGAKVPSSNAADLISHLQDAQRLSSGKPDCTSLTTTTIPALEQGVASLPAKTDSDIRGTIKDGIDNLKNLIAAKCATKSKSSSTTTTSSSTSSSTPTTTTTTTTTSSSPPPPPPPTHTTTTSPTPPPSNPSGGVPPGQAKKGKGGP
jgi:cell division septation protein DedD